MAKTYVVDARTLAEVVKTLILRPQILGELDEARKHGEFVADVARTLADHCGGDVQSYEAGAGDTNLHIRVRENDSLPSPDDNVWTDTVDRIREKVADDVWNGDLGERAMIDALQERINDGDILAEDVATRMVRYGLMDPIEFVAEMRERMELADADLDDDDSRRLGPGM